jgi:hypothetical protein
MKVIRSYKTKGIKELQAFIEPGTSHYKLQWDGGGELPAELSGVYTSMSLVDSAVLTFVHNQPDKKADKASKSLED